MKLTLVAVLAVLFGLALADAIQPANDNSTPNFSNILQFNLSSLINTTNETTAKVSGPELAWTATPPKAIDDASWQRFVCKGTKMVAQMAYSDFDVGQLLPVPQTTAQSPWRLEHLSQWGYEIATVDDDYRNLEAGGYWGVGPYFRRVGLSDKCTEEGGEWRANLIAHFDPDPKDDDDETKPYNGPDGKIRRQTGAQFFMAVLPGGGVMAQNRLGPREAAKEEYPDEVFPDSELPELQKSSDMMWCLWEKSVPPARYRDIKFFVSATINNPTTLQIMVRALEASGNSVTPPSGKFDMESEEGRALLASPNGAGFSHFLIQRKNYIGLKTIEFIYVFQGASKSKAPCLLFTVKNLKEPVPRPEDKPAAPASSSTRPPNQDPNQIPAAQQRHQVEVREVRSERNILRVRTFNVGAIPVH